MVFFSLDLSFEAQFTTQQVIDICIGTTDVINNVPT